MMPDHAYSRYYAGLSHRELGDHTAAVRRYRESLRLVSDEGIIHYNLAISLRALGRESEAKEQFAAAERLNEDLKDPADEGEEDAVTNDAPLAAGAPAMANSDAEGDEAAAFRPIGSVRELAGEWKADYTLAGATRVQITAQISDSGMRTSSRVATTVAGENEGRIERTEESSRIYVDGADLLIGEPGEVFDRYGYQYDGDRLRIDRPDLGGTVVWYRQ